MNLMFAFDVGVQNMTDWSLFGIAPYLTNKTILV